MTQPEQAPPSPEPSAVEIAAGVVAGRRCCTVPGCGRDHKAHGYCRTHYRRWQRHGDPLADVPIRDRAPVAGPSAWSALRRVRTERGPAAGQACAGCGAPAAVWSYDGTDPADRTDSGSLAAGPGADEHADPDQAGGCGARRRYSLDPARYRPLCRFCHRRSVLDRAAPVPEPRRGAPALDVDRAVRLYTAGASAAGIAALLHISPDAVLHALRTREVAIRPAHTAIPRAFRRATGTPHKD